MWIKAVYCTKDLDYAKRLERFFDREYGNKIELSICSSMEAVFDIIGQYKIDILLFGDEFSQELLQHLKDFSCTCAFLTEQAHESAGDGFVQLAHLAQIEKYRRGDSIYRDILDAYSAGGNVKRIRTGEKEGGTQKIYVFTSAQGGCGTSTIAEAYAKRCAAYEKVLYLDLGLFALTQIREEQANAHGMDEIILALKSRRNILPLKLMSAATQTEKRFYTYGSCSNGLDMLELCAEDMQNLLNGLLALDEYQKIILDIGSSISDKEIGAMKRADRIIYVMDESDIGKQKYSKFCVLLENAGRREQMRFLKKMRIFRNKVSQMYDGKQSSSEDSVAGWAPYVSMDSYDAVVDRIARSDSFSSLEIRDAE